jgi:hypothetical protein
MRKIIEFFCSSKLSDSCKGKLFTEFLSGTLVVVKQQLFFGADSVFVLLSDFFESQIDSL